MEESMNRQQTDARNLQRELEGKGDEMREFVEKAQRKERKYQKQLQEAEAKMKSMEVPLYCDKNNIY